MKKNIKFILLLVFIAIVAGFSGYLMKKNNLNDELVISDPTISQLHHYLTLILWITLEK